MYSCFAAYKRTCKCNNFHNIIKIGTIFTYILVIFALLFKMNIFKPNIFIAAEPVTNSEKTVEEELSQSTSEVLDDIDFSELEDLVSCIDFDFFNGKTFKQYVKDVIDGKEDFDISDFFQFIKALILKNIKSIISPLLIVLCVALLCVLFSNMQSGKIGQQLEIVYLICFSVVVIIVSVIISKLVFNSKNGIVKMQKNMNAIFPILLLLMSNMGGAISAKAYTPLVSVLSNIISNIFVYFLLPLFSLSLVLSIISHISSNTKLNKLNGFIKSLFKWVIGSVCAVFMGYLAIKGFTAGASDGISIKATKYAIKNYVPILGGYISEGFELVKAGSMIVKNAIGFVGSLVILFISLLPILSIAICELGLKLISGILEPVGATKTANLLDSISGSLKLLSAIVIGVAVMYFLTIYLITCTAVNII